MPAAEILNNISKAGLTIDVIFGDLLKVEPKDKITETLREQIRYNKPALLAELSTRLKRTKSLPSPIAIAWLLEHRQALDKAGWTRAELYRRNKSKRGIAWLLLWDKPFFLAYLHESGVIEFECSDGGRDCIQTARPARRRVVGGYENKQGVS